MVYGVPVYAVLCSRSKRMNGSIENVGRLDDNGDIGEN
jgi:hypothetical protein